MSNFRTLFAKNNTYNNNKSLFFLLIGIGLLLQSCQYKKAGEETPVAASGSQQSTQGVDKSFFQTKVTKVIDGVEQTVWEPKTFLCGWASEAENDWWSQNFATHNVQEEAHCNIQFEITERNLIAKKINPSFPNDPKRWNLFMQIPITSHYYFEKEKDSNGKETNKMIENSSRSHWSARPYMKLNLDGVNFRGDYTPVIAPSNITAYDVEWDFEKNFLAFSIYQQSGLLSWGGEAHIRINFLKFDHNPNFKKTPYNDKNSRYMNILHVMGTKINGVDQVQYASHWDLSKKHEVYLHGFPDEYREIGVQVVNDWNKAFRTIGAMKDTDPGFVVADQKNTKHPFDLRYPSIIWVSDKKIASYSPLGVGQAISDVRNGEILWGGITLYGGALEEYIKMFSPTSSGSGGTEKSGNALMSLMKKEMGKSNLSLPGALTSNKVLQSPYVAKFQNLLTKNHELNFSKILNLDQMLSTARSSNTSTTQSPEAQLLPEQNNIKSEKSKIPDYVKNELYGKTFCTSRTFEDVALGWNAAIAKQTNRNYTDIVKSVVKELITHEYGHFLGLGHQFKENILPNDEELPQEIKEWNYSLAAQKEKATEKNNFTQMTSVMGYRSAVAEVSSKIEDVLPGPQDYLVLNYLYNQKYSTYKKGDKDITFVEIPQNGILPEKEIPNSEYHVAYFPQCNDWLASLSIDPYCNRFDRGNKASEIVTNYISDFNDSIIKRLFSMTDISSGNHWLKEHYLYYKSFDTYGRIRTFYDFMRRKYKSEFEKFRHDESALFQFAKSCEPTNTINTKWDQIYEKNPELKDLCYANLIAVKDYEEKLKLKASDYTKVNFDDVYIPGGMIGGDNDSDYSKASGSYSELSAMPIKYASLYALTSPAPWGMWGDNYYYSTPDQKYFVGSLYPIEYTKAISSAMKYNLYFAALGKDDKTTIGYTALALGYFNQLAKLNNDGTVFSENIRQQIRSQTDFNFSVVAIILTGERPSNNKTGKIFKRFTSEIYDLQTDEKTPSTETYVLPNGRVIVKAENMFLFPITKFQFLGDEKGYVLAYKLDYYRDQTNPISDRGIKAQLKEVHDSIINACTKGQNGNLNGLSQFFNTTNSSFDGFVITQGIATDESGEKRNIFLKSVDAAFEKYYSAGIGKSDGSSLPKKETCEEALRGVAQIVTAAALLNGYYLPELTDLIQK